MLPSAQPKIITSINSTTITFTEENKIAQQESATEAKESKYSLKTKIIIVPVYVIGIGQIFIALLLQSAASYVECYRLEANVPLSATVSISSQLAKSGLLTMYSLPDLQNIAETMSECLISPAWWINFPSHIKQGDYSKKGLSIKLLKVMNIATGLIPGLFFGYLNEPIAIDFRKLVNETQPGQLFNILADWSANQRVIQTLIACSIGCNLIATHTINDYVIAIIKENYKEWREQCTCYEKTKFILGTTAGIILSGIAVRGFFNFYPLSIEIGHHNMGMPLLAAQIFSGMQCAYMVEIAVVTGFPLGRKAIAYGIDIITNNFTYPSAKIIALNMGMFALTLATVLMGGLPNVWQAEHEDQNTNDNQQEDNSAIFEGVVALIASAITEFEGTYHLLMLLALAVQTFLDHLMRACSRWIPNKKDMAEAELLPTTEISVNGNVENDKKWWKHSNWSLKDCIPFFSICGDGASEDGVSHEVNINSETEPLLKHHRQ